MARSDAVDWAHEHSLRQVDRWARERPPASGTTHRVILDPDIAAEAAVKHAQAEQRRGAMVDEWTAEERAAARESQASLAAMHEEQRRRNACRPVEQTRTRPKLDERICDVLSPVPLGLVMELGDSRIAIGPQHHRWPGPPRVVPYPEVKYIGPESPDVVDPAEGGWIRARLGI
eukprot:TRINITY_DN15777_c0_g1_i1.p2 TRINITY_DN15777_c0_g1~~TRINITY_DN15777_c0_g1_i1.p2  ORF type:complete len:174 (+),score=29.98 TRINITY_DN15777_c0_g1_i1:362-883(+)